MKKFLENFSKWIIQWLWILTIIWFVWIIYAAWTWSSTSPTTIVNDNSLYTTPDNTLTSAKWNELVNKVISLESTVWNLNQTYFQVKKNSSQTLREINQLVTWQVKIFDTNNDFDLSNWIYKPKKPWVYRISCKIVWGSLGYTFFSVSIYKNWIEVENNFDRYNWTAASASASTLIYMNWTTDYIDCRSSDSVDTSRIASTSSIFEWYYIWE